MFIDENKIHKIVSEVINESLQDKTSSSGSKNLKDKRKWVNARLDNNDEDKYDHAMLAYTIWPDKDKDSARSYFSKCVKGKRRFTDDDIKRLYSKMKKGNS